MGTRTNGRHRQGSPEDVGTLWTLQRCSLTARCALLSWPDVWEVRVEVDGETLTTQRCARTDDAFAVAERWKLGLLAQSWQQVIPVRSD